MAITTIACVTQSFIYLIYVEFSFGVSGDKSGCDAGKQYVKNVLMSKKYITYKRS